MQTKIHSIHFNADVKLLDFIETKIGKLNSMYDNIIGSEVFLRLERTKDQINKVAEIKIAIPGKELFAKKQCKSFEEAADEAVSALKKQIVKSKGKRR